MGLPGDAHRGRIQGALSDLFTRAILQPADQLAGGGSRLRLALPNNHVATQAIAQGPSVFVRSFPHVLHRGGNPCHRIRPGEKDIGLGGGGLLGGIGEAPKVEGRATSRNGADAGWVQHEIEKFSMVLDGLAVQELAENRHVLPGARVARLGFERLTRQVAGNDIKGQSPARHAVEAGDLPGQLGRPHFAHADGEK